MFRTEIPFTPHPQQLPHSARVLTMGSCFAETIGARLTEHKMAAVVNPFGTIFNPVSACQLLRAAAGEDFDWQQHLVEARGRWQSHDLHATLGAESPVALLQQIQEVVQRTGEFLRQADVVMLTLGSALVYRLKSTGELVSNCHKLPAEQFEKELLTPDEIINAVAETHAYLRRHNPTLRFILTVSPVRHLKDTLPLNAVSKSALRLAAHYLSELLPDVDYFPAYELLLDDLRDYRFYADDMLHPSVVAQDYIWERFTRTYFDANFGRFKKEWQTLRQALAHRPLYAASPEHRQFLENTLERLQRLGTQVDVAAEMDAVQQQLFSLPLPSVPASVPEPVEDDEERIDIGEYAAPAVARESSEVAAEPVSVSVAEEVRTTREMPDALPAAPIAVEVEQVEDDTVIQPKKKRRSRGGAKRTARKRAALEALAAQEEASPDITDVVAASEPSLEFDTTDATAEAVATGEIISPESVEPLAPPVADAVASEPEVTNKPRKGRTAGQILNDKKKTRRPGKNRGRQLTPLYASPEASASGQVEATEDQSEQPFVAPTLLPVDPASDTPIGLISNESRPAIVESALTPPTSAIETPESVSSSAEDEVVLPAPPELQAEEVATRKSPKPKAPAKPRAARSKKTVAVPEALAAAESEPTPVATSKPKATRKKATKPTPAVEAPTQVAATLAVPEAVTPKAAPKRRSRPPRKKPPVADDTSAT